MKKQCTAEELKTFLDHYPRPLVVDITGICDPPLQTWNDFTLGVWPRSVVASCSDPNGAFYGTPTYYLEIET